MTRQVGYLWWRGRVLRLCVRHDGSYYCRDVPNWLREQFRSDVQLGRVRLENP